MTAVNTGVAAQVGSDGLYSRNVIVPVGLIPVLRVAVS